MGMRQRLGVASCLLGDPELLILDEPMNGLDPAGMHEMRSMIISLVDEGRTVVLSSHLLDEVERTCDAVAIVDRGRVVRQGPIDELTRGAGVVVQVDCADPARAAHLIDEAGIAAGTSLGDTGLTITLPAGASREIVADINRRLVGAGISVYGLQEVRASLEDWFLSVTTRVGENPCPARPRRPSRCCPTNDRRSRSAGRRSRGGSAARYRPGRSSPPSTWNCASAAAS